MQIDRYRFGKRKRGFMSKVIMMCGVCGSGKATYAKKKEQEGYIRLSRYYDAIYILFHTGLRISEFCGLTVSEIEFGEMRIKVDHQLQRTAQMQYVIEEPKTEKGIRYVPMTEAVAACFRRIIANRKTPKVEPMVEGYAGFTVSRCRKLPLMYAGTPFALIWQNPG